MNTKQINTTRNELHDMWSRVFRNGGSDNNELLAAIEAAQSALESIAAEKDAKLIAALTPLLRNEV